MGLTSLLSIDFIMTPRGYTETPQQLDRAQIQAVPPASSVAVSKGLGISKAPFLYLCRFYQLPAKLVGRIKLMRRFIEPPNSTTHPINDHRIICLLLQFSQSGYALL